MNFIGFSAAMQDGLVILVCSDASTLLVYKDSSLQWNCKLPFTALVIRIGQFQVIHALIHADATKTGSFFPFFPLLKFGILFFSFTTIEI